MGGFTISNRITDEFYKYSLEDKNLNLHNLVAKLKQDELRRKRMSSEQMAMAASMRNN